ncbi:hypothetical protein [Legionella taurinensis]|uniref:Uncharacterized protein n=1 Tax=Legionella taurinensis TaxID=70611 RepID=A0A3A5L1F7_9GAMM|nr:hypothetical protein [Legionella taurinensis]RJT44193.1 hypothetical protein D6J04_12630 [Legionella taurinensis]RJT67094.1 hypothetical protein D6J03_08605 [Legionella taurinensis]STY26416.1 Uncharacterised protein [Legionella taurinensis]
MKISFIKNCLTNYDKNKGYLRVLKDETHISQLRVFYNELGGDKAGDRDLNPHELLKLVTIALGKKNWNDSQSADVFTEIFKQFGGKEAYQYLVDKNGLTAENVAFLENTVSVHSRNSQEIGGLAILLDYSSQSVPPLPLSVLSEESLLFDLVSMYNKTGCLSRLKKEGLLSKNALLLIAKCKDVEVAEQLIRLMNAQNSFNDANLLSLSKNPEALEPIFQILTSLGHKDVFPPTFCEVTTLFSFNAVTATNLKHYLQGIEQQCIKSKTTAAPEIGKKLMAHAETLANQNPGVMEKTLSVFKQREWIIADYLDYLLAIKDANLYYTVLNMAKLSVEAVYLPLILEAVKTESTHHRTIVSGVVHLKEKNALTEEHLIFILSSCPHAHTLAVALTQWPHLKDKNIPVTPGELLKHPSFAEKIVCALIELSNTAVFTEQLCRLVMSKPESAEAAQPIFQLLKRSGLCTEKMVSFLYQNNLMNPHLHKALVALDAANILTDTNIIKLSMKATYLKTIASACATLNNANASVKELNSHKSCTRLNQDIFDALIAKPLDALKLAESSGGLLSRAHSPIKDEGACEFVKIRGAARSLALLQRSGLLFGPYLEPHAKDQKKPFTLEERQALEKKSVFHIASFLGNSRLLEKAVEDHVAKEGVEGVFNGKTG